MKTTLAALMTVFTLSAFAAGSWATINTKEYGGDTDPSTSKAGNYQAYYCTKAAADTMFGSATVDGINTYLRANFATGKNAMATTEGSVAIDQTAYFEKAQYTFFECYGEDVAEGEYLAVVFYNNEAFRVFGKENAVWDSGTLTFDDENVGKTVGDWVTVPEPTGGVLFLLGLATLGLRRKRVFICQ